MEQQVKIAAKLYKCRDAIKGLFGTEFFQKIVPYKQLIKIQMQKSKVDEM